MTLQEFSQVFNRLCVALRESIDDTGVTQGVYFDALSDLSASALAAGASVLSKEPGRRFFPTSAEWRTACLSAHVEEAKARLALPSARVEPWHHDCDACEDTGWVPQVCDGGAEAWPEATSDTYRPQLRQTETPRPISCGRRKTHQPHDYVVPCGCRPSNLTYQRHQRFGASA